MRLIYALSRQWARLCYQDGEYNEYYVEVDENGQALVELTKHGYGPNYQKIYVETADQRLEFNYDEKSGSYRQK